MLADAQFLALAAWEMWPIFEEGGGKCIENSMKNIHTEVKVQRVIVNVICRFESGDSIFL